MAKVANYDTLEQIGNELYTRSVAGNLDFTAFQQLFAEARAVCGEDGDALEMFCPYAKPPGWWDWMTKELQKTSSQRVA
jgi:hypothetical protein